MTLKQLFTIFGKVDWGTQSPDHIVLGVHSDSRKISKDMVFVAVRGVDSDGHDYISQAIDQGAIAIVLESNDNLPEDYGGTVMQVLDSKLALAELLSQYYGNPEDTLISIGITGTNGKTSSSYLIEAFLNEAQVPCGVIGTIDHHLISNGKLEKWKTSLTTPDANTFFQRLKQFKDMGAKAYVMEVSSHSLKQKRVPVDFDVAVFTNFTRDHLDYHKTMDDYLASKALLFTEHLKHKSETFAILNADDLQVVKTRVHAQAQKLMVGKGPDCDFSFQLEKESIEGMEFTVNEKKQGSQRYRTSLVGAHNIYNITGAIAVARALGVSHSHCQRALEKFSGIPGRLQRVPNSSGRHVFIDYAHTPDALEKVLQSLRALSGGKKIVTVFGCGGDRDQGKRPLMGQTAQKFSDFSVVTSDNPRTEDPKAIIDAIVAGMDKSLAPEKIVVEADREKALRKATLLAAPGDIIVVAGKGHEDYQIVGNQTLSFSDFEKMKSLLQGLQK